MNKLNNLISLFPNALSVDPDRPLTVEEFFQAVRDGRWARPVEVLRGHIARGDRQRYDHRKRELPAVTLSCHCMSRERSLSPEAKDVTHSGVLQGDFDAKDNPVLHTDDDVMAMREKLIADPCVLGVFVGPSGEGLKTVIAIDPERHAESWFAAEVHFRTKYGLVLDRSTTDPMRLCFVSHDPLAEWKQEAEEIPVEDRPASASRDWLPPVETTSADVREMLKFVPSRPDYDTWLRVASAVWSVLPLEEGCRVLNEWSPEEKAGEYATKHGHKLKQVGIGTLAHLASQHGFDARAAYRRKRWAGRIRFAECSRAAGEDPTEDTAPQEIIVDLSRERVVSALKHGQAGDARLWCELRAGLRLWNIHAKTWMIYEDGLWQRDAGNETRWDLSDTLQRVYKDLGETIRKEIEATPAPEGKKDPRAKELAGIYERCAKLCAWDYLSGVERFAATSMHRAATDFDRNPDILVLQNGTLDFSEGVFREHRPGDCATIRSPITFDPAATCPRWESFLALCVPDVETRTYLARAVGYSLTGRVDADALFFTYGKGANGKSTFVNALKILLGDLMTTVPIAALLAAKSDNNFDYHKASMEGKRVVLTDEMPEGRKLAESQVKALTGGDAINARRPYEQPYTFTPTHKLWLMGNHKPEIVGTDEGIWRRVHMIPFLVTIPVHERRDRTEITAEFVQESAGILNWAIRGLLEYRDIGLRPPSQVVEATRNYREESDQFGTFLVECTDMAAGGHCKAVSLAKAYSMWCEQNGENPRYRGTRQMRKIMTERGFHAQVDRNNSPIILGIRLKMEGADNVLELAQ